MAGYPWLKMYTAWLDDPRFSRLSDTAKALYFEVYLLAGKSDAGGLVLAGDEPASIDDISYLLRRPGDEVWAGLAELQTNGFVDLDAESSVAVRRFVKEQGPSHTKEKARWSNNQKNHRNNAKGEAGQADTEKEKDKEKIKDKDKTRQDKRDRMTDQSVIEMSSMTQKNSSGGGGFEQQILDAWTELTGLEFKPNQKFSAMVADWESKGKTLQDVRQAILDNREKAKTPLYLENIVLNLNNYNKPTGGADVAKFRKMYEDNKRKNNGG